MKARVLSYTMWSCLRSRWSHQCLKWNNTHRLKDSWICTSSTNLKIAMLLQFINSNTNSSSKTSTECFTRSLERPIESIQREVKRLKTRCFKLSNWCKKKRNKRNKIYHVVETNSKSLNLIQPMQAGTLRMQRKPLRTWVATTTLQVTTSLSWAVHPLLIFPKCSRYAVQYR